jgi:hypothetical protein
MFSDQVLQKVNELTIDQQNLLGDIIIGICNMMKHNEFKEDSFKTYFDHKIKNLEDILLQRNHNDSLQEKIEMFQQYVIGSIETKFSELDHLGNLIKEELKNAKLEQILAIKDSFENSIFKSLNIESITLLTTIQNKIDQMVNDLKLIPGNDTLKEKMFSVLKDYFTDSFEKTSLSLKNELSSFNNITISSNFYELTKQQSEAQIHLDYIKKSIEECVSNSIETKKDMNSFLTSINYNSSKKGEIAEILLTDALTKALPTHEVLNITSKRDQKGKMDILLSKTGLPDIMVECKKRKTNVPIDEVEKFEYDIIHGNKHGILVSLDSGIRDREHFQIKTFNNNNYIGVYLTKTGTNVDLILYAMNIIYFFHENINKLSSNISIGENEIKQFRDLEKDMDNRMKTMKNHAKAIIEECDKLKAYRYLEIIEKGSKK